MMTRRLFNLGVMLGLLILLVAGVQAQIGPGLPNSPLVLLDRGAFPYVMLPGSQIPGDFGGRGAWESPSASNSNHVFNVSFGPRDIPRTSDVIEARLEKDGKVWIGWQGEPRAVNRITFALLDKNRKIVKEQTIYRPPAETRLARTKQAAFYAVCVEYINGTSTTVVCPLPLEEKKPSTAPSASEEPAKQAGEAEKKPEPAAGETDPPAQEQETIPH